MNKWERKLYFKKNKGKIIKRGTIVLSVLLLVVGVIYITYSKFDSKVEFTLINGKVIDNSGDFKIISYEYDDEKHDVPPAKGSGYKIASIDCTNADGTWDNNGWGLYVNNISGKVKCNLTFEIAANSTSSLKIGDTVNYSIVGNEGLISEWVVIKEGEEPELVAKTSSLNQYTMTGTDGLANGIKHLNDEAASYGTNTNIVKSTRHMGYLDQMETCVIYSTCVVDTGYETDVNLVTTAMGTISTGNEYWLASRQSNSCIDDNGCDLYVVNSNGSIGNSTLLNGHGYDVDYSAAIRPIITLQSNVDIEQVNNNTYSIVTGD